MDSSNPRYTVFRIADDYPQNGKPSYGLQPVYYYLSREQAKLGNEVCVVARRKGNSVPFERIDGVDIYRVEEPFSLNAFELIRREKKKHSNSILHIHSTSGAALGLMRKILDLPVVSHVHGSTISRHMPVKLKMDGIDLTYSASKTWYYYFRERLLWSSATRIASVSGAVKSDLKRYYQIKEDLIDVVYNGVDTNLFRPLRNPTLPSWVSTAIEGKKVVLYVGHFGPRKGIRFLVRAMRRVVAKMPDSFLVCIGGLPKWLGNGEKSYLNLLQDTVKEENLEGKVLLIDRVPNNQLPNYYASASVFVLPSYYESFAKVVAEAMSCMKPVIVTRGGGTDELIEEGISGLKVDYGSIATLTEAILEILQNESFGRELGIRGRQKVESHFTWSFVAKRINDIYDKISFT